MSAVLKSTLARGEHLLLDSADRLRLREYARSYQRHLDQLERAHVRGDVRSAENLTRAILRSHSARVCALVRTMRLSKAKPPPAPPTRPFTMRRLDVLAATLSPYRSIPEAVRVLPKTKDDGSVRYVTSFGLRRKALQRICADILDLRLPSFDFDFLRKGRGADAAMLRIAQLIEEGGYEYVVTIDIKNCFRSAMKDRVAAVLPLPETVTNNVLLIQDEVELEMGQPTTQPGALSSMGDNTTSRPDEAARQGIPMGSSASTQIMSRAVLGPLLATTAFASRVVLYGDDVGIVARDEAEAEAIYEALHSLLQRSPVGPLSIGRSDIQCVRRKVNFVKYAVKRRPAIFGGGLRITPSFRSYWRFEERSWRKFQKSGEAQVDLYRQHWTRSFPLWHPTSFSALYLRLAAVHAVLGRALHGRR